MIATRTPTARWTSDTYALQDPNWNVIAIADTGGDVSRALRPSSAYGQPVFLRTYFRVLTGKCRRVGGPLHGPVGTTVETACKSTTTATATTTPTGRFVSRDPIGYKSRQINQYAYVANSPLVRTDPSGLVAEGWKRLVTKKELFFPGYRITHSRVSPAPLPANSPQFWQVTHALG